MPSSTNRASADTALGRLAAALATMTTSTVGDAVTDCARQRLFDTLGATRLGLATSEGRLLRGWADRLAALGPPAAATRHGALCAGATRTTEVDDIDIASCCTVGAAVVPVALAVAAARPEIDGRALLAGIVAGYEAMIRLGRAIHGASALYKGVWPSYVTAPFAAAATTARLLDLDAGRTAQSLALALARSNLLASTDLASFGFRYYAFGCAASAGCVAACAAAAGVEADVAGIGKFCERIGVDFEEGELLDGLGRDWRITEVDTKMLPSSRQSLASVEAFLPHTPLAHPLAELEHIAVYVPREYRDMVDRPTPPTQRVESMIGVQYSMALAAFERKALYDVLRESLPMNDSLAALMAKISVRADDALSAAFPRVWGSRVTVRWRSGEETTTEVSAPMGSRRNELSWRARERRLMGLFTASRIPHDEVIVRLIALCQSVGHGEDRGVGARLLALLELSNERAARSETPVAGIGSSPRIT